MQKTRLEPFWERDNKKIAALNSRNQYQPSLAPLVT